MGKWIYLNGLVLLISIVFMYLHFGTYYQPPLYVYLLASFLWIILLTLGYYIFISRMNTESKAGQTKDAQRQKIKSIARGEKPKVVLKKERPKVMFKNRNDNNHGK